VKLTSPNRIQSVLTGELNIFVAKAVAMRTQLKSPGTRALILGFQRVDIELNSDEIICILLLVLARGRYAGK